MEVGIISMRYAKALITYARSKRKEDRVYEELSSLSATFRKLPRLREALDNPVIPRKEKIALIYAAADGNKEPSEEFAGFIQLVLKQRRESYLQSMALMYQDLYRKLKHIGVGRLTTAVPVDHATEKRIRETSGSYLHARMELETVVDPSIEGGFIFDVNDYRLDASIATQLKRVKQQFIEKNKRIV